MAQYITLHNIWLPEFDKNRWIVQQKAFIFKNDSCWYDMMPSTNFLQKQELDWIHKSQAGVRQYTAHASV